MTPPKEATSRCPKGIVACGCASAVESVCSYHTQDAALHWVLPGEAIVAIDVPDDVFDATFLQRPRAKR